MLKAEEQMEIAVLKKHGESIRAIALAMGVSRNTVRRHLRGGDGAAVRKPAVRRVEKLDPFKSYIVDRLKAAAPDLIPASVLFREVKAHGYADEAGRPKAR
jgi:transposase